MQFLARFVVGGLHVALVPVVARHFSPHAAGLIVLFPIVTLTGFWFLAGELGDVALTQAAGTALLGLPTVAAFLLGTRLALSVGAPSGLALALGVGAWLAVAAGTLLAFGIEVNR